MDRLYHRYTIPVKKEAKYLEQQMYKTKVEYPVNN